MEKMVDEKILEYINAAEKKEAQKDISNGAIKIGQRYYEFEETEFFEGKLKMYIPKDFQDMPLEARKFKYPSENRPEVIKCNEDGSIAVTFKIIDSPLDEEYVEKVRDMMKLINKRLNPANIFFDEGLLKVKEKNIGYFDFKSSAIDDFLYNFIFLLAFQEKTLMGTFSCGYSEAEEWKDIVFEMVNTLIY
ncbi:hypothetical protein [Clostridium beijerinckii]|uniref:hypothetical protein n=1 Tax=Clostridium beijerinckii TaxID=1520 RepID=UPI00098C3E1F|nr:hypothetical protein [Clostridium beijerinckii]MBE6091124.1 hypothetical protein [Clostridium beijerinckii]NRT79251.1 hypothetical protein [Clostridium beijerinckii]OOM46162.1 hypothetical protein CBEIJ_31960 [Clostridium beijerinckii]